MLTMMRSGIAEVWRESDVSLDCRAVTGNTL
jgi:hypothetical protein